ncbi:hypothetical protein MUK42_33663, partial [Musa troglodytarum]
MPVKLAAASDWTLDLWVLLQGAHEDTLMVIKELQPPLFKDTRCHVWALQQANETSMHAKDAEGIDTKESELTRRTEADTFPRNLITVSVGFLKDTLFCGTVANSVLLLPITTLAFFPYQSHSSPFLLQDANHMQRRGCC